ncbi:MAG: lysophospholipid transporter LplT [Gammaproteobacteria bacterium]
MSNSPIQSRADAAGSQRTIYAPGMLAVLGAQFLSALADNALLFAAIAALKARTAPDWMTPLLQDFFVLAYVVLAPWVGPFADALPKGRVMMLGNLIKLVGSAMVLFGVHPLPAYGLVGLGAALYSPAKYGILSELVPAQQLVKANGLIEGSTIVAILLGTVAGGALADRSVTLAFGSVAVCYLLAAIANVGIPRLPAAHPLAQFNVMEILRDFSNALRTFFANPDSRFGLLGASLFWGAGSTLRFLLVAWVPVALHISDTKTPANLNAAVAIGVPVGAALAAKFITLPQINRVLAPGLMMGIMVILLAPMQSMGPTVAVLALLGMASGMFIVPINALIQECGHRGIGAGHAVAVLNFFDNFAMLLMVGLYAAVARAGAPVVSTGVGFGLLLMLGMSALAWFRLRRK